MTETAFNKVMSGLKEARAYAEGARIGFHVNDRVSADKQKRTSDVLLMEKMRDAVFSYLGEWWTTDQQHHRELQAAISDNLNASGAKIISSFAQRYSVSRTLSAVSMETAFNELASLKPPQEVVPMVNYLALKLGAGRSLPISAASKLLWLRFREDIPIYDSLACAFVEQPFRHQAEQFPFRWSSNKDQRYGQFVERWKIHYREASQVIKDACSDILQIKDFTAEKLPLAAKYFDIVSEEWFRQRIFDHYIQTEAESKEAR